MKSDLKIKKYINYTKKDWEALLLNFDASINYTSWFLDYVEILNKSSEIKNFTFVVYQEDCPVAITPLYLENINGKIQISMGQEPVFVPIFSLKATTLNVTNYIEFIINQINIIANLHNCILARFIFSPLIDYSFSSNDYFKFGYDDNINYPDWYIFKSNTSFILDINNSKDYIFKNIRKGHKSNIRQTQKIANLVVLDQESFNEDIFNEYVSLYFKVKGDRRSLAAFKLDSLAIKSGLQFIVLCLFNDEFIGAIAFHTYNDKARYNSSFQLYNNTLKIYPTHFLLWSGIEYLIKKGYKLLEIGEQVIETKTNIASLKDINLSHFKAGWGCDLKSNDKVQKEFNNV
jgi:hypothetical protein